MKYITEGFVKNLIATKLPLSFAAKKSNKIQSLFLYCFLPSVEQLKINPENLQIVVQQSVAIQKVFLNEEPIYQCNECSSHEYLHEVILATNVNNWNWQRSNVVIVKIKWVHANKLYLGDIFLANPQHSNLGKSSLGKISFLIYFLLAVMIAFISIYYSFTVKVYWLELFEIAFVILLSMGWLYFQSLSLYTTTQQKMMMLVVFILTSMTSFSLLSSTKLPRIQIYLPPLFLVAVSINILWSGLNFIWFARYIFAVTLIIIGLLYIKANFTNKLLHRQIVLITIFLISLALLFLMFNNTTQVLYWGNILLVLVLIFWVTSLFAKIHLWRVKNQQANQLVEHFDEEVEKQAKELAEFIDDKIEEVKLTKGFDSLEELESILIKIGYHKRLISEIIRISLHKKDFDRVLEYSQQILNEDPNHKPALVAKAKALQKMHHWEEALVIVQKLALKYKHIQATILATQISLDLARVNDAKKFYQLAKTIRGDHPLLERLRKEIEEQSNGFTNVDPL